MPQDSWPSEWLRATLALAVLRVLADGPTYGYAIGAALEERGFGAIKGGTLYPLLSRLEVAGHVQAQWREGEGGPGRKYYALTNAGEGELRDRAAHWSRFSRLVTDHLGTAAPTIEEPS